MKKLLMVAVALLLLTQAASAGGIQAGVGGFAGLGIPVVQDDQSQGTVFGFKGRVKASFITLEPNVVFTKYGDPDIEGVTEDPEGSKLTSFGLDALLGSSLGAPGVAPYFFAGIASYKTKNDQLKVDESDMGISAGGGIEIGVADKISLDVRARFVIVGTEGGASRKAVLATAGLNYHFGL